MNLATMLGQSLISKDTAMLINSELYKRGQVTENRVIIITPKEIEGRTASGIIIPGEVTEGVPRKGICVQMGEFTEENRTYTSVVGIGNVLTYGLYAGKEIDLLEPLLVKGFNPDKHELRCISVNEIMYSEYPIKLT